MAFLFLLMAKCYTTSQRMANNENPFFAAHCGHIVTLAVKFFETKVLSMLCKILPITQVNKTTIQDSV